MTHRADTPMGRAMAMFKVTALILFVVLMFVGLFALNLWLTYQYDKSVIRDAIRESQQEKR